MKSRFRIDENDEKLKGIHAFLMTQVQVQLQKGLLKVTWGPFGLFCLARDPEGYMCSPTLPDCSAGGRKLSPGNFHAPRTRLKL